MLSLYYAVGQFVSANSREETWGTGAIDTISFQLRREMPGLRGFSATSIKIASQWLANWTSPSLIYLFFFYAFFTIEHTFVTLLACVGWLWRFQPGECAYG